VLDLWYIYMYNNFSYNTLFCWLKYM
jgi:hypothetical protein